MTDLRISSHSPSSPALVLILCCNVPHRYVYCSQPTNDAMMCIIWFAAYCISAFVCLLHALCVSSTSSVCDVVFVYSVSLSVTTQLSYLYSLQFSKLHYSLSKNVSVIMDKLPPGVCEWVGVQVCGWVYEQVGGCMNEWVGVQVCGWVYE